MSEDWYDNRLHPYALIRRADSTQNSYLQGLQFTWNLNGTLGNSSEGNGNGVPYNSMQWVSQSYRYDGVNRLQHGEDTGGWSRDFNYDQYGNTWVAANTGVSLAGNTPTSNVYNAANQISGGSYDNAGNQTVVNGNAVFYNAENRVVSVTVPQSLGGGTEILAYDGLGQRVQKTMPGGTTVYVYDAFGQLAAEYASAPSPSPCQTCYLSYDHLGSVRLVTDEHGGVVARHDYLPFGEEIPGGTAGRTGQFGSTTDSSVKFTGQIRDSETGLDYFNARYFSGALGRFTSPDPGNAGVDITNPQTWNAYADVGNNPLNAVDPTGMFLSSSATRDCGLTDNDVGDSNYAWLTFFFGYDPYYEASSSSPVQSSGGGGSSQQPSKPDPPAPAPAPPSNSNGNQPPPTTPVKTGTLGIRNPGQGFRACMQQHANDYSLGGLVDASYGLATGKNSLLSTNPPPAVSPSHLVPCLHLSPELEGRRLSRHTLAHV